MTSNGPRTGGAVKRNFVQVEPVVQKPNSAQDGPKKAKSSAESVVIPKNPTIRMKEDPVVCRPTETFKDVAGMDDELDELFYLLQHSVHPELGVEIGASDLQPRGILLSGPPGSGKTFLAHAIAGEMERVMIKISAPEVVSGISGDSEERLREIFRKAETCAPSILFLDEIESITPKRENTSKSMEERIVSTLRSCLDDLSKKLKVDVIVIAATNCPDDIDPGLRRAGRFEHEIRIGIPNEASRLQMLKVLADQRKISPLVDWEEIAHRTPGYVGADLKALLACAARIAIKRILKSQRKVSLTEKCSVQRKEPIEPSGTDQKSATSSSPDANFESNGLSASIIDLKIEGDGSTCDTEKAVTTESPMETAEEPVNAVEKPLELEKPIPHRFAFQDYLRELVKGNETRFPTDILRDQSILLEDFEEALRQIQPSAKREGFATVPDVSWSDIGALNDIKDELISDILNPVRYSKAYERVGAAKPSGVLLCGPPGCGKTLLAKAVANQAGLNFISVKGPELLNMYVGESERAVRQVFMRARNSSPCVVFFDEIDALVPRRSTSGNSATERVVTQMLTELDGLEPRKLVFVIGATNRPDILDPAILRPGRLDKVLFVDLPDLAARTDILSAITKKGTKPPLAVDVNLPAIAARTDGYSGADLAALVHEAASLTLRQHISYLANEKGVCRAHEVDQHLDDLVVTRDAFDRALIKTKPSVSQQEMTSYQKIKARYHSTNA